MTGPDAPGTYVEQPAAVLPAIVDGDVAMLRPCGEFDIANQRDLGAAIHDAIISGHRSIIVDLREVTFIDASTIHMLLRNQRLAESRGCGLSLINLTAASALILRVLHIGPPLWNDTEDSEREQYGSIACLA